MTLRGKSGQARDFDAIAFVGAAFFDAPQKNDFIGRFFDGDVNVFNAGEQIGELGEFVIVRGEERARARVCLQMLDDGPGDREAVESRRAAAHFIEQDQACAAWRD